MKREFLEGLGLEKDAIIFLRSSFKQTRNRFDLFRTEPLFTHFGNGFLHIPCKQ